jgi:Zn-dependent protease
MATPSSRDTTRGLHVGRIFGIDLEVDLSWFFIFILVAWNLAGGVLPVWHPEWSVGLRWSVALAAALLFFASVVVHELSHSLVARARNLPVQRITLFLFGGVSNLEREPASAGTEFLMAVVGPLASIVLGGVFLLLGGLMAGGVFGAFASPQRALSGLGPLPTLLFWLGPVNIFVGLFNLIPGFPLDGGRILRSILWRSTGDLRKATRWASAVGQCVAWILILTGAGMIFGMRVPFFGTGLGGGIWLVFIGWFLNNAAISSYRQTVVRQVLDHVPVFRLMRRHVPTVTPQLPVRRLIDEWILVSDERAFPVTSGGDLVGLVCLEDVRELPREEWDRATVADIMTRAEHLTTVEPDEDLSDALRKLTSHNVRQMPVVDHGHLVGLLRQRDIMKWIELQTDLEAA